MRVNQQNPSTLHGNDECNKIQGTSHLGDVYGTD
jgi:hypothetical protein